MNLTISHIYRIHLLHLKEEGDQVNHLTLRTCRVVLHFFFLRSAIIQQNKTHKIYASLIFRYCRGESVWKPVFQILFTFFYLCKLPLKSLNFPKTLSTETDINSEFFSFENLLKRFQQHQTCSMTRSYAKYFCLFFFLIFD